jgi:multiple sugar transport system substrate-binding protein
MREVAAAFDRQHRARGISLELTFFPDAHYAERLAVAAAARDMPDVFDLDGPLVARYVDAKLLAPLEPLLPAALLSDFLPTIIAQGTVQGRLYALGAFDSSAALYFDRDRFARAGVEPPDAYTALDWQELLTACERLARREPTPLALHMNESGDEWYTYAFSPLVWSGGGKLISDDGTSVRGVLSSPENVRSLRAWQALFVRGYAATDPVDPDPFGNGAAAMDWSGHWMARAHLSRLGERLGVMPLPRIGPRAVAACGSYCWAISSATRQVEPALAWLLWVTDVASGITPLVRANAAIPGRWSAFAAFPEYERLPYSLFRDQLERAARPRPRTPYYATLTQHFAGALRDIARGADVAGRLLSAENEIERVLARRRARGAAP